MSLMRFFLLESQKGRLTTSLSDISDNTGLTVRTIRTCLSHLTTEIGFTTTGNQTVYVVINYDRYAQSDSKSATRPQDDYLVEMERFWGMLSENGQVPWSLFNKWRTEYGPAEPLSILEQLAMTGRDLKGSLQGYVAKALQNRKDPSPHGPLVQRKPFAEEAKKRGWT